jgi:hypothetical protein
VVDRLLAPGSRIVAGEEEDLLQEAAAFLNLITGVN